MQAEEPTSNRATEPTQKRRKKWGQETEAGKALLQETNSQSPSPSPVADPAAKRQRRSRWEPAEEPPAAATAAPTLAVALNVPDSIKHLVDFNPEALELTRQLNLVGTM
jgi:hypothetical protein